MMMDMAVRTGQDMPMDPSMITCPMIASMGGCDDDGNSPEPMGLNALMCAESCNYRGPCTGDKALAMLISPDEEADAACEADPYCTNQAPTTCETLPEFESMTSMIEDADAYDNMMMVMKIAKEVCGNVYDRRRARKMAAAPHMDALKARNKLAAAHVALAAAHMLRSIKTTAHRLTQAVAVSPAANRRAAPHVPRPAAAFAAPAPFLRNHPYHPTISHVQVHGLVQ